MPNIPPLVSHMPDSEALYAPYTATGGGSTQVIFNNGGQSAVLGITQNLAPNASVLLKEITVTVSYGTSPLALRALLLAEVVGLSVTSTTTPVSGDTLTFQFVGTPSGGTAVFLGPPLVLSGAELPSTTPVPVVLNSFGDIGAVTQAVPFFNVELQVLYTTTGATTFELTTSNYTQNAQIIGCVKS